MKLQVNRIDLVAIVLLAIGLVIGLYDIFPKTFYLTPRSGTFLFGVLFHPLIHSDTEHLLGNLYFILPCIVILSKLEEKPKTLIALIYIGQGILVWFAGKEGLHYGCSGVAFGLGYYILLNGVFSLKIERIIVSVFFLFAYYSIYSSFMTEGEGIGDDSHVCGSLTGFLLAFYRNTPSGRSLG